MVNARSMVCVGATCVLGALALGGCVVGGTGTVRSNGSIQVRPTVATSVAVAPAQTTVYAQPQPVYQQPQPVYQQPTTTTVVVGAGAGGVYAAPPAVGFQPVTQSWVTTGYAENDYVAYHMSLRARQFAGGYFPITQLYRGQMYQGQRQYVSVDAQPGRCYRIIGVGGEGVRDLDLRLLDMQGNVIDQDVATDNFPVLGLQRQLCLNWQGSFRVEVIMYSGGGTFGIQAFATGG
ncbi:MAG: hypothetical protein JNK72_22515 [Myxococcales bacterium]|nr:hypothetical protein [Myxococcales bacterium]